MKTIVFIFLIILSFLSCNRPDHCIPSPDISGISIDLEIERIDQQLFEAENIATLTGIIDKNQVFAEFFLSRSQYPHDSILAHRVFNLLKDPEIQKLRNETVEIFGDLSELEDQFSEAFRHIKYYYPDFNPPRIQAVFTGLAHDMYVSDSILIFGLDYYLGNEASYRPLDVPEYILKRYRKENIVPNSLLLISDKYNRTDVSDQRLVADMVYYGKAHYFARQMLPCVPDSIFLGYTPEEMKIVNRSEQIIWANFIENELLFETNHFLKDKFIAERPKTFEISQHCPGRIGRWVGWEIIKTYMDKNPETSLGEMMNETNALKIFERSRYKPG